MTSKLKMFDEFKSYWADCTLCPLSELRTQVVFGHGSLDADLVMIGEAPGKDEDLTGQPFIGKAGEKFNSLLQAVGIDRGDIWVTNTCLCRPVSTKPGKENRAPLALEMRACSARLRQELAIIKPKIIVLAGNTPLYMATRKRGITKNRGWQSIKLEFNDFIVEQVYATLHPASLLYGSTEQIKQKRQWIWNDWQEISGALSVAKKERVKESSAKNNS